MIFKRKTELDTAEKILTRCIAEGKKGFELDYAKENYLSLLEERDDQQWEDEHTYSNDIKEIEGFYADRGVIKRAFDDVSVTDIKGFQFELNGQAVDIPGPGAQLKVVYKSVADLLAEKDSLLSLVDGDYRDFFLSEDEHLLQQQQVTNVFLHYLRALAVRLSNDASSISISNQEIELTKDFYNKRNEYRSLVDNEKKQIFPALQASSTALLDIRNSAINQICSTYGGGEFADSQSLSVTTSKPPRVSLENTPLK